MWPLSRDIGIFHFNEEPNQENEKMTITMSIHLSLDWLGWVLTISKLKYRTFLDQNSDNFSDIRRK